MAQNTTTADPNPEDKCSCSWQMVSVGILAGMTISFMIHSLLAVCRKRRCSCYKNGSRGIYSEMASDRTNNDYVNNVDDGTYSVATETCSHDVINVVCDEGYSRLGSDQDTDAGSTTFCSAACAPASYMNETTISALTKSEQDSNPSIHPSLSAAKQTNGPADTGPLEEPQELVYAQVKKGKKRRKSHQSKEPLSKKTSRRPSANVIYAKVDKHGKNRSRASSAASVDPGLLQDHKGERHTRSKHDKKKHKAPVPSVVNPEPVRDYIYAAPKKFKGHRDKNRDPSLAGSVSTSCLSNLGVNRQANIDLYARVDKNKSRKGKDAWTDVNNETEVVQRSASVRCRGDRSQVPYIKKREITRIVSSLKERNDATLPPAPNEQQRPGDEFYGVLYSKPLKTSSVYDSSDEQSSADNTASNAQKKCHPWKRSKVKADPDNDPIRLHRRGSCESATGGSLRERMYERRGSLRAKIQRVDENPQYTAVIKDSLKMKVPSERRPNEESIPPTPPARASVPFPPLSVKTTANQDSKETTETPKPGPKNAISKHPANN